MQEILAIQVPSLEKGMATHPSILALRISWTEEPGELQSLELQSKRPSLDQEDPLEKGMATHSSILAWRIPWTEEPGELQSMGSRRVRHN